MIKAWRIVKAKHKKNAFNGAGCQFVSGRWHDLMVPMVYCSDSQALAALETFVHLQEEAKHIKYVFFEIQIPKIVIQNIESITTLPKLWRMQPPSNNAKRIGSDWVSSNRCAVLSVPSSILPASRNYLLNPNHSDINKLIINKPEPFSFDSRLWK